MPEQQQPNNISRPGQGPASGASGAQTALDKFRALPKGAQIGIGIAGVLLFMWIFGGPGGGSSGGNNPTLGVVKQQPKKEEEKNFTGLESDRPAVMQNVYEQQRREMSELRSKVEESFEQRDKALQDALAQNQELQRQMTQMMSDFTAEIKNLQGERAKDAERLAQLADQQKSMEMNSSVGNAGALAALRNRQQRITQHPLGSGGGGRVGQALLSPLGMAGAVNSAPGNPQELVGQTGTHLPFVPPLGFVKGTLLNGVDALVGGTATPALVRLQGVYKTAMNNTISLDGCLAMVEFSGNISTERAVGKPLRMTCVYPDNGASTYNLTGYVVDAEDGIIGVPGVLYEGDPTRIAASVLADFAAGVGEIIQQNQETTTVDSAGTQKTVITGEQTKAQMAGGVDKAMSSLKNYLMERVNRVQPFIRLDALREVHLVILNGTELRNEGSPWTLLFDAAAADRARAEALPTSEADAVGVGGGTAGGGAPRP